MKSTAPTNQTGLAHYKTIDSATAHATGDDLAVIQHLYRNIWTAALALNERVQASRTEEPTP